MYVTWNYLYRQFKIYRLKNPLMILKRQVWNDMEYMFLHHFKNSNIIERWISTGLKISVPPHYRWPAAVRSNVKTIRFTRSMKKTLHPKHTKQTSYFTIHLTFIKKRKKEKLNLWLNDTRLPIQNEQKKY